MIYNLLIAIILIVAFFMCKITSDKQLEECKSQLIESKRMESSYLSNIELLRRESLDSYRKGLFDGLQINKDKPLNCIDSKPIKTIEEHREIVKEAKADKKGLDLLQEGYDNMMNYTGDVPEGK